MSGQYLTHKLHVKTNMTQKFIYIIRTSFIMQRAVVSLQLFISSSRDAKYVDC